MSCCVLYCVNNENSGPPNEDVIFYRIPKEYHLKQFWTEAIGRPEWELRPNSAVCSEHFEEFEFTISETGEKLLVDGAVPSLSLNTHKYLQEVAKFKTCRVCLGMDRRMYHIRDYNLQHAYEMIVGVMVEARDRLPQMLCWECASKLMSYKTFKEKAQKTQQLLSDKLAADVCDILTVGHIKAINRIKFNLKSHLTLKFTEPDKFDVNIDHDRVVLLPEIKIEDRIKSEEGQEAECNVDLKLEDDDVKDELNHSSGTDSDDIKLSERRTRLVRKRKLQKVAARKRSKKVVKEKNNDGTKFQRSAQRAAERAVELPTFEVRRLTLEEQQAAVAARAHSAAYLDAPYKCEVCYRGFRSQDTFALHALRHSERCGKFECVVCKRRFRLGRDVRLHAARNHADQFACKACSFVTQCRRTAVDHQKWHAGNTYQCPHCPTTLTKFTSYMSHLRVKHSSRFSCELCGYTFVSVRGVQVHKAKCHLLDAQVKLEGPYCEECKLRFASDAAYQRHLTQSSVHSSDDDPWLRHKLRFANDAAHQRHLTQSSVHSSDSNPNRIRNEKNYPPQSVKRHSGGGARRERDPPQEIPCEQCGELQESYLAYARHFRAAHPGLIRTKFPRATGNCMCEQCGRMFATKTLLLDHTATHTGEKRFKCDSCDKAFTNKKNLRAHQNVHGVQVSTHRCPYCEREFFHYQNCNRHVKTVHKGVKQFQCEICGKEFTSAAGQRAHVDHVHHKKPRPKRVRARAPTARTPPTAYRD